MGKWSQFKDAYPRTPLDAERQDKINAVLNSEHEMKVGEHLGVDLTTPTKIKDMPDAMLAAIYGKLREKKDFHNSEISVLELEIEAITQLFVQRFEDEGIQSQRFEDGVLISISDAPYPVVKDKLALREWINKNDLTDLLSVNYQTLASLVKERLSGAVNESLPDGVDVYMKTTLSRRTK